MPFSIRPHRRIPVLCSVTDNVGPFGKMSATLFSILLLVIGALLGCASENLDEVRAAKPIRTTTFETPYDKLATCVKQRVERELWLFGGEPSVHWKRDGGPLIRVYAIYSRNTLFDVTIEQTQSDRTTVEYRQGVDGYGIQSQTWGIIVSCNRQGLAPVDEPAAAAGQNH
ncbi:hypothetical protein AYO43_06080 [Nitrospira sp. SCGC AG-212-E16]|nr:hypothetical protein AYO43_06080 [Nitrospira sp. SCGC AG-212-E16]